MSAQGTDATVADDHHPHTTMDTTTTTDNTTTPTPTAATAPLRPKSPPLAFEKTPNDALIAPLLSPSAHPRLPDSPGHSSSTTAMGRLASPSPESTALQRVVDQQASALNLLHEAFAAERHSWTLERERLYQRIASLEKLLKSGDHYSAYTSPSTRPAQWLPSIAEDFHFEPLSKRRPGAPRSIDMPSHGEERRSSVVGFATSDSAPIRVEEIPISPAGQRSLSPPPLSFRREAGNTPPLHAIRPPTPPPKNSLSMDGIEDTPTRHNTHINTFLTRSNDDESEDRALTGPLNMPELPSKPKETNFTLEMLSKKLEQIEQHPEESSSQPLVFAQPSPGLASPGDPSDDYIGPKHIIKLEEAPLAPVPTGNADISTSHSELTSNARSPRMSDSDRLSPNGPPLSPQQSREMQVQQQFEQGGIKLKKKPSVNFGAPFGQLGGFGSVRRQS